MMRALSDEITNQLLQHPINVERKVKGLSYANMVTLRGAGKKLDIPTFESLHELKPFVIAPTAIIRGVGLQLGIDLLDDVEGMTGYYDSNLEGKCLRAGKEFTENKNKYDFGFVHVKAVDDAGHDKNEKIKIE